MNAFLLYGESSYPIPPGDLIRIGSHSTCDIQIMIDQFVSRQHCSVSLVHDQLTIVDVGSTHGTLVNGIPVVGGPAELVDGDRIQIGQTALSVSIPKIQDRGTFRERKNDRSGSAETLVIR